MVRETFADPRVVELSHRFICVRVDDIRNADVCREFATDSFPTTVFLTPRRRELARMIGKESGDRLIEEMRRALRLIAVRPNVESPIVR